MRRLFFMVLLFISLMPAFAEAAQIVLDTNGDVVTAGSWSCDYDAFVIVKNTPDGTRQWAEKVNLFPDCEARERIAIDASGNICATTSALDENEQCTLQTTCYDGEGELLRQQLQDVPVGYHALLPVDIAAGPGGAWYLLAEGWKPSGNGAQINDIILVKLNSDGDRIWLKKLNADPDGTDFNWPETLLVDENENVYLAGSFSVDYDDENAFLMKIDEAGAIVWRSFYESAPYKNNRDSFSSLAVDAEGNIYAAGQAGLWTYYDTRFLVARYDPNGVLEWVVYYGEDDTTATALDLALGEGGVFATGVMDDEMDDGLTIALSVDGEEIWQAQYQSEYQRNDRGQALALGPEGEAYVAGITDHNYEDNLMLLRYDAEGALVWDVYIESQIGEFSWNGDVLVHPVGLIMVAASERTTGDGPLARESLSTYCYSFDGEQVWLDRVEREFDEDDDDDDYDGDIIPAEEEEDLGCGEDDDDIEFGCGC